MVNQEILKQLKSMTVANDNFLTKKKCRCFCPHKKKYLFN